MNRLIFKVKILKIVLKKIEIKLNYTKLYQRNCKETKYGILKLDLDTFLVYLTFRI